jgi:hypothetical protein
MIMEHKGKLDEFRKDASFSKEDVLDAWEARLDSLVGKVVSVPVATGMCVWRASKD